MNASASIETAQGATRRLRDELLSLMMANCPGISAFPEGDNLLSWVGTVTGPADCVYSGLSYKISLKFPPTYPYSAPTVRFETPIWHPNVDWATGAICLDILKEKWSAIYNVQTILLSIQSLLDEPNNDSPLNAQAAQMWNNSSEFKKQVLKKFVEVGGSLPDGISL